MKARNLIIPSLAVFALAGALTLNTAKPTFADNQDGSGMGYKGSGEQGTMRRGIERISDFLNISVEDLQAAKEEGQTVKDLVEEQGLSLDDFHSYMTEQAVNRWRENGTSEEEIASRLQKMEERRADCDGTPHNGRPF